MSSVRALSTSQSYWQVRELVVIGIFAATVKLSTLIVALAGGGMNPVSLILKNLVFTTLLIIMLYKVRKFGTLTLFTIVSAIISALLLGLSATLLPAMIAAALLSEGIVRCFGGTEKTWAPVVTAGLYDLLSKSISLGSVWLFVREAPAMMIMSTAFVCLGYLGSLAGLVSGIYALKELRHAGIIRQ